MRGSPGPRRPSSLQLLPEEEVAEALFSAERSRQITSGDASDDVRAVQALGRLETVLGWLRFCTAKAGDRDPLTTHTLGFRSPSLAPNTLVSDAP